MGPLPEGRTDPRYFPFNYSMHPQGADFVRGGQKSRWDTKKSEKKTQGDKKISTSFVPRSGYLIFPRPGSAPIPPSSL